MSKLLATSLLAVVVSGLVIGCDDDTSKKPAAPAAPAQTAAPAQDKSIQDQAKDAVAQGKQAMTSAAADAKQAVTTAAAEAKQTAQNLAQEAKPKLQEATKQLKQAGTEAKQLVNDKVSQFTNGAVPTTAPATTQQSFDYKQKLDQAVQYVKENKVDLADKALAQVEAHKASVPASLYPRIESLRKTIDAAKLTQGAGGFSLPKF